MGARAQTVEDTRRPDPRGSVRARHHAGLLADLPRGRGPQAGVSVQTVLRHFGSRANLIDSNIEFAIARVEHERFAPEGDVDAALKVAGRPLRAAR